MKQVNIINNIFNKNKYKIIFNSIDLNETNIIKITNIKSIPFLKTYFKGILNNNLTNNAIIIINPSIVNTLILLTKSLLTQKTSYKISKNHFVSQIDNNPLPK